MIMRKLNSHNHFYLEDRKNLNITQSMNITIHNTILR